MMQTISNFLKVHVAYDSYGDYITYAIPSNLFFTMVDKKLKGVVKTTPEYNERKQEIGKGVKLNNIIINDSVQVSQYTFKIDDCVRQYILIYDGSNTKYGFMTKVEKDLYCLTQTTDNTQHFFTSMDIIKMYADGVLYIPVDMKFDSSYFYGIIEKCSPHHHQGFVLKPVFDIRGKTTVTEYIFYTNGGRTQIAYISGENVLHIPNQKTMWSRYKEPASFIEALENQKQSDLKVLSDRLDEYIKLAKQKIECEGVVYDLRNRV